MKWQKRARLGVALFGIASAAVVYSAIGERQSVTPLPPPERMDPKATIESVGAQVQQERGSERDFDIKSQRQLFYENGSSKLFGVEVHVRGRQGRDFVISAQEAQAGEGRTELQLSGEVKLAASDGFQLSAAAASFNQDDGMVRAPGEVTFAKGRMHGGGVGMTYDQMKDVLSLAERARVNITDEAGNTTLDFAAGAAVLDRGGDTLTLDGEVHVARVEEVFISDRAVARLTADESAVTYIELRGSASVEASGALDAMSARDIDLDYTDDGTTLERVLLDGDAAVALAGRDGAPGRQITGNTLDLALAPDGSLTRAVGQENVQLLLPASEGTSARSVRARQLEAAGEPERGLTSARFTDEVVYREEAERGAAPRVARSRALRVALDGDAISAAIFTGSVRFEEQGLRASAAEARYEPAQGTLRLTGADAGGPPRVADEQITIDARAIDVTLEGRRMRATGEVKTALRSGGGDSKMPGMLDRDQPANVQADSLEYDGGSGRAIYRGSASLWQGETALRGDTITIDQQTGDLLVVGAARSNLALDNGASIGRAAEIRYDDQARVISYVSNMPPPAARGAVTSRRGGVPAPAPVPPAARGRGTPVAPVAAIAPPVQAQLSGPQGDLKAGRIDVVLARTGSRADRLEAHTGVSARIDTRLATGDRLTYFAADDRYVLAAAGVTPARVDDGCRETSGKTLTFFKSADRIIVDGNEEIRTQTKTGGACTAPTGTPAR